MPADQKIDYVELPANEFDSIDSFYTSTFAFQWGAWNPLHRYDREDVSLIDRLQLNRCIHLGGTG